MAMLCLLLCAMLWPAPAAHLLTGGALRPAAPAQDGDSKKDAAPEVELHKAIASAGNDRAALVRNLKDYLTRFPDSPRRASVYQALVEACQETRDTACELEYAERLIAVQPDDSDMMMLAVELLQKRGDDASLTRASGYVTRVLDRIEKSNPAEKPPQQSLAEWRDQQDRMRTGLYAMRGNIEKAEHNYDVAIKDLKLSYSVEPNAVAAIIMGEIAEAKNDRENAVAEYLLAFVLPEDGPAGKVDRHDIRMKLGNVWRQVHGSEKGLGEAILTAYDHLNVRPAEDRNPPAAKNEAAKDIFDFVLARPGGSPFPLAQARGKVVALSFWATWCSPCRAVEPIFNQVAKGYAGNSKVEFLAVNTDEDRSLVPPFVAHEKWDVPVAYSDGLDALLNVQTLPTLLVLDTSGKIVYRINEFESQAFAASLKSAIDGALGATH